MADIIKAGVKIASKIKKGEEKDGDGDNSPTSPAAADTPDADKEEKKDATPARIFLDDDQKTKLGENLAPIIVPTVEMMHSNLGKAKNDETKQAKCVETHCIPMINSLAQQIQAETEEIIHEKEVKLKKEADAAAAAAAKTKREKDLFGYETGVAKLKKSFARKMVTHHIAAKYYSFKHFWYLWVPLQILLTTVAILSFLDSFLASHKSTRFAATIVSLVAGVLTVIAQGCSALDRYLNYHTLHQMHHKAAALYAKLKWELSMTEIGQLESGEEKLGLKTFQEKLDNLEETNGDLIVPFEIVTTFDSVSNLIRKKVDMHNFKIKQDYAADHATDDAKGKLSELPKNTSVRGSSLDAMRKYFPKDYWAPAMTEELLIYSYGVIASKMTKRSYFGCPCFEVCFGCGQFPHKLPNAEKIVDEAYTQFTTTYMFTDRLKDHTIPMEEDYAAKRRGTSGVPV